MTRRAPDAWSDAYTELRSAVRANITESTEETRERCRVALAAYREVVKQQKERQALEERIVSETGALIAAAEPSQSPCKPRVSAALVCLWATGVGAMIVGFGWYLFEVLK